jgi:hypothetical protein
MNPLFPSKVGNSNCLLFKKKKDCASWSYFLFHTCQRIEIPCIFWNVDINMQSWQAFCFWTIAVNRLTMKRWHSIQLSRAGGKRVEVCRLESVCVLFCQTCTYRDSLFLSTNVFVSFPNNFNLKMSVLDTTNLSLSRVKPLSVCVYHNKCSQVQKPARNTEKKNV